MSNDELYYYDKPAGPCNCACCKAGIRDEEAELPRRKAAPQLPSSTMVEYLDPAEAARQANIAYWEAELNRKALAGEITGTNFNAMRDACDNQRMPGSAPRYDKRYPKVVQPAQPEPVITTNMQPTDVGESGYEKAVVRELTDNKTAEYVQLQEHKQLPEVLWEKGRSDGSTVLKTVAMGKDCPLCHQLYGIIRTPEGEYYKCSRCGRDERISALRGTGSSI